MDDVCFLVTMALQGVSHAVHKLHLFLSPNNLDCNNNSIQIMFEIY